MVVRTVARALVCGSLAALAGGCTPIDSGNSTGAVASVEPAEVSQAVHAPSTAQVITTLQTRDHEITVYAAPGGGPMFTIAAAGGTVLAERLTGEEFRRSFPGLREHYDAAFADESGASLDASVSLPHHAPSNIPVAPHDAAY